MNMIILTAAVFATLMLFVAHEHYWIFQGGVGLPARLLIEVGPVLVFLGASFGFLYDYVLRATIRSVRNELHPPRARARRR